MKFWTSSGNQHKRVSTRVGPLPTHLGQANASYKVQEMNDIVRLSETMFLVLLRHGPQVEEPNREELDC